MTVFEIFFYRQINKESRGFLCYGTCLRLKFTHFGAKLASKYQLMRQNLNINVKTNGYFSLACPSSSPFLEYLKSFSFIKIGLRHMCYDVRFYTLIVKVDLVFFILDKHCFLTSFSSSCLIDSISYIKAVVHRRTQNHNV